jgi:hypothetical protein
MRYQHLFVQLKYGNGLFAADAREMIKKHLELIASFEIIQQRLQRYPGTDKNRRPTENIGIAMYEL